MKRRTPFYFSISRRDGVADRVIFYALDRSEATRCAHAWATRLGYEVTAEAAPEATEQDFAHERELV